MKTTLGYQLSPLNSVADVLSGFAFKSQWFESVGDKIIRIGDIVNEQVSQENCACFEAAKYKIPKYCITEEGDILMALSGATTGKIGIVKAQDAGLYVNQRIAIIRGKKQENKKYLKYVFSGKNLRKLLLRAGGAAQANLSPNSLRELKIPLPPLAEQKRIAAILDKTDAIRRKRQASIKLADDFLRATFLDMFGDPVTNPKGWEVKELGEITFIDAPMVDPKESQHLDLLHIGPDRIEKETGKLLPAKTAREDRLISGKFLFSDNHVLYSKIRPYLRKVALPGFCGLCSADMYPVRPDEEYLTREYLWSILISPAFTHFTESLPGRANIPKINRKEFASYKCMLPTIELQKKYTDIFNNSKKIERKKAFAFDFNSDLFNSLTQRAFRGEL